MGTTTEYNTNSTYRSISWSEGQNQRKYILGQYITTDVKPDGSRIKATIWSIEETSAMIENIFFKEKYTIKVKDKKGVVYNFFTILSPKNMTLLHNHEELVEI